MKKQFLVFSYVCIWLGLSFLTINAQTPNGGFVGQFIVDGKTTPFIVHNKDADGKYAADFPLENVFRVNLDDAAFVGNTWGFVLKFKQREIAFAGIRQPDDAFTGTAKEGTKIGNFRLVPVKAVNKKLNEEFAGSYEIAKSEIIDLGPMDETGGMLVFFNHRTRREGILFPLSDSKFVTGQTLGVPYPFAITAEFTRDQNGKVSGLKWQNGNSPMMLAKKIAPHVRESVTVKNKDVTLKGDLLLPADAKKPVGAIIFAHGSGSSTRNIAMWNLFFVRLGYAVLSLDKRGAGESTGDWRSSSLEEIADDWLAGVEYLKTRQEIDRTKIGVHASSQGGWTAPMMAAKSKDVAFVIVRAGAGTTVADAMAWECRWLVREAGFSEAEAIEAEMTAQKVFGLMINGAKWIDTEPILLEARKKAWAKAVWFLDFDKKQWENPKGWTRLNAGYDSADWLRQVKIPILWFLADLDHNLSSAASRPRIDTALRAAGNRNFKIVNLPNAGHGFTETKTGNNSEFAMQTSMTRGYWDEMERWLKKLHK